MNQTHMTSWKRKLSIIKATESNNRQVFLMVLMIVLSVTFAPRSPITRIIHSALVWVRFNVFQMFRHGKKQIIQDTPMVFFSLKYYRYNKLCFLCIPCRAKGRGSHFSGLNKIPGLFQYFSPFSKYF